MFKTVSWAHCHSKERKKREQAFHQFSVSLTCSFQVLKSSVKRHFRKKKLFFSVLPFGTNEQQTWHIIINVKPCRPWKEEPETHFMRLRWGSSKQYGITSQTLQREFVWKRQGIFHILVVTHNLGHRTRRQAKATSCTTRRSLTLMEQRQDCDDGVTRGQWDRARVREKDDAWRCSVWPLRPLQVRAPRPYPVRIYSPECTKWSKNYFWATKWVTLSSSESPTDFRCVRFVCVCCSPFLCFVNNVTDLHVERPVLILQRPISGLLCKKYHSYQHAHTHTHYYYCPNTQTTWVLKNWHKVE